SGDRPHHRDVRAFPGLRAVRAVAAVRGERDDPVSRARADVGRATGGADRARTRLRRHRSDGLHRSTRPGEDRDGHEVRDARRNFTPRLGTRDASGVYRDPGTHAADQIHAAATRLDRDWAAVGHADARAPYAILRVEVTQPQWCAHLRIGMLWDVYSYDYAAA